MNKTELCEHSHLSVISKAMQISPIQKMPTKMTQCELWQIIADFLIVSRIIDFKFMLYSFGSIAALIFLILLWYMF